LSFGAASAAANKERTLMPSELMSPPQIHSWPDTPTAPRFDLAARKIAEKIAAERAAQERERAFERAARERVLFQLD
jgi:hypothetical protein